VTVAGNWWAMSARRSFISSKFVHWSRRASSDASKWITLDQQERGMQCCVIIEQITMTPYVDPFGDRQSHCQILTFTSHRAVQPSILRREQDIPSSSLNGEGVIDHERKAV
jgi:hypothetical protein